MARQVDETERLSKRNEILDCALKLVHSIGYEQMSIQDILSQMGISKGAFYHYFVSKPALLEALIIRTGQQAEEMLLPIVENPDLPTLEKLEYFFKSINRWKSSQKAYMLEILKVWYADENAIVRQKLVTYSTRLITGLLNRLIQQGIDEGIFKTKYPEMVGTIFYSLMIQMGDAVGAILLEVNRSHSINSTVALEKMMSVVNAYTDGIERILGTTPGTIHLIDRNMLAQWLPDDSGYELLSNQKPTQYFSLEKELQE
jgi:TetR/AcrR family transcriptional repressor of nem operon